MKTTCWTDRASAPPAVPLFRRSLLIFCLSLLTHVPGISSPLFDHHAWAQTLRASIARNYVRGGMRFLRPELDYRDPAVQNKAPQFPLYSYLLALLYHAFGSHDALGRLLSALFAAGSAVFLYLFARRLLADEAAALAAAAVFCVLPIRIYFMRAVMPDSMAVFCLLAGFYFVLSWAESGGWRGALGVLCLTLVPLLKLPYLPLVAAAAALVQERRGRRSLLDGRVLASALFFAAALLGWYGYANYGAHKAGRFVLWLVFEEVGQEWSSASFWSTHFLSRFPELTTTYAGLAFFFLGAWALYKAGCRFAWTWLGFSALYIALCGKYGRVHQYASLPFAPVNAVFIGAGVAAAARAWRSRPAGKVLLPLLLASIPVHAALRIRHWYRLDELWVLRAQAVVERVSRPEDLFYINSTNQPFYLYHIRRKGFVCPVYGAGREQFESALEHGARYFLTPAVTREGDWSAVEAEFSARFALLHKDSDFLIYRLRPGP